MSEISTTVPLSSVPDYHLDLRSFLLVRLRGILEVFLSVGTTDSGDSGYGPRTRGLTILSLTYNTLR